MSALDPIEVAYRHLDSVGTQASAICTLGELLYAAEPERLNPEIVNHLGCLLEVIGGAMLESAHEARRWMKPQ